MTAAHMDYAKLSEPRWAKFFNIISPILIICIATVSSLRVPNQSTLQKALWMLLALFGAFGLFAKVMNLRIPKCLQTRDLGQIGVLGWFFVPFALVAVYSVIYCTLTNDQLGTRTQSVTTTCFILVDLLMALWLINTYGKKSIIILAAAIILSYAITFILAAKSVGVDNIVTELQKSGQKNLFESHDVGVAVVPLITALVYMSYRGKCSGQKLKWYIIAILIGLVAVLLLCGKRSAYLSLVVAAASALILCAARDKQRIALKVLCTAGFLICFLYVVFTRTGVLDFLYEGFGTLSDRYYVWKCFDGQYSISPLYLGKGFGYVHRYMVSGIGPGIVTVYNYLHNSILQIYIEAGFIGFLIWFGIYYFVFPMFARRFGGKRVEAFVVVSIVAMSAMFTIDNTLTYPVYQVCLMTSIGAVYLTEKPIGTVPKTKAGKRFNDRAMS